MRIAGKQQLDLFQRLVRLVAAIQHQGQVLPGLAKARRQFERAPEQAFGLFVATDAYRQFGQHAHGRDVGRRAIEVLFEPLLRLRQAVLVQGSGGGHERRIADRMADMARIGLGGADAVADRGQVIAQRQPGLRQIGLEFQGTTQRGQGFVALTGASERDTEFVLGQRPLRLGAGQLAQHLGRLSRLAQGGVRPAQQQQSHRMILHSLEDLACLFAGEDRIGCEQPRGMRQRNLDRGGRLGHGFP